MPLKRIRAKILITLVALSACGGGKASDIRSIHEIADLHTVELTEPVASEIFGRDAGSNSLSPANFSYLFETAGAKFSDDASGDFISVTYPHNVGFSFSIDEPTSISSVGFFGSIDIEEAGVNLYASIYEGTIEKTRDRRRFGRHMASGSRYFSSSTTFDREIRVTIGTVLPKGDYTVRFFLFDPESDEVSPDNGATGKIKALFSKNTDKILHVNKNATSRPKRFKLIRNEGYRMFVTSRCGDGIPQEAFGEGCDDGNTMSEDGCSSTCQVEECGDGIIQEGLGETCEDGNTDPGDGCSETCETEEGFTCHTATVSRDTPISLCGKCDINGLFRSDRPCEENPFWSFEQFEPLDSGRVRCEGGLSAHTYYSDEGNPAIAKVISSSVVDLSSASRIAFTMHHSTPEGEIGLFLTDVDDDRQTLVGWLPGENVIHDEVPPQRGWDLPAGKYNGEYKVEIRFKVPRNVSHKWMSIDRLHCE